MSERDESDDDRDLADYHCVESVVVQSDPTHGETHRAIFDPDVLTRVYRELRDAIRADGYELVAFGRLSDEDRTTYGLHERFTHASTATFVYRGAPDEE